MSPLLRKLTVEFIGTFLLMMTVGLTVAAAGIVAPLATGAVLMVIVLAGARISGGHYNPAVSTAVLMRGRMMTREYIAYVVTQGVAAVLAGGLIRGLGAAPHDPAAVAGTGAMLAVEFLLTFALTYGALNVATAKDTKDLPFFALAIGLTFTMEALAAGSLCGAAFNPAVALGASVLGTFAWNDLWIYLLAELVAGAAAAAMFLPAHPDLGLRAALPKREPAVRTGMGNADGVPPAAG